MGIANFGRVFRICHLGFSRPGLSAGRGRQSATSRKRRSPLFGVAPCRLRPISGSGPGSSGDRSSGTAGRGRRPSSGRDRPRAMVRHWEDELGIVSPPREDTRSTVLGITAFDHVPRDRFVSCHCVSRLRTLCRSSYRTCCPGCNGTFPDPFRPVAFGLDRAGCGNLHRTISGVSA
jgi:hypothetical protein